MSMLPTMSRQARSTATLSRLLRRPPFSSTAPRHQTVCVRRFATNSSADQPTSTTPATPASASKSHTAHPSSSTTLSTAAGYDQGLDVQPNVSWANSSAAAPGSSSNPTPPPPPPPSSSSSSSLSTPSRNSSSSSSSSSSASTSASSLLSTSSQRRPPKAGQEFFVDIDEEGQLAHPVQPYIDPQHNAAKGRLTPLSAELHQQIKVRGPLTMSDFMYQCMQNPKHGYYMAKKNVIGGKAATASTAQTAAETAVVGDFITSPEISQLFGELLGVWMVDCWHKLGQPPSFSLVELGPGRGTLMRDMIRTIRHWPGMHSAMEVHLLETSPLMRERQREMLGVTLQEDGRLPFFSSASVYKETKAEDSTHTAPSSVILPPGYTPPAAAASTAATDSTPTAPSPITQFGDALESGFTRDRVRVTWHTSLVSLPASRPILLVGHEFLDALPVYHFVYRKQRGWSEVLVDSDYSADTPHHFRFVLSPADTPASSSFVGDRRGEENEMVEVQAASASVVEDVTQRIGRQTGAALFIDYASTQPPRPTLQAVQNHSHVHPLHEPGLTDLTTTVDFGAMAASADKAAAVGQHDVFALPLISQHSFLRNLNIARRLEMLVEAVWERVRQPADSQPDGPLSAEEAERKTDEMVAAATRLVSEDASSGGMGGLFKVLGVVHGKLGTEIAAWNEVEVREKRQRDKQKRAESNSQTLAKNVPLSMRRRHSGTE